MEERDVSKIAGGQWRKKQPEVDTLVISRLS